MRNDLVKRVVVQELNIREGTSQLRVTIPKDIALVVGWEKGSVLEARVRDGDDKLILERDLNE